MIRQPGAGRKDFRTGHAAASRRSQSGGPRGTGYPGLAARAEFFAIFAVAAIGGFLLSASDVRWLPAAWGTAAMLLYLALVRARKPLFGESEEFADSFYYLGFLLTLVALASVLIRLGTLGDDLLRTVLAQFGPALTTAIVGLAGRTPLLGQSGAG